jgi:uncharacterized protein YndB with AHSA1/START domain
MRGEKGPSGSVDIHAPREQVFAYVQDMSRYPEWGRVDVQMQGPAGPAHEGFTYQAVTTRGKPSESTVFVSEVHPPERLEFEAEESAGLFGHEFTFEGTNGTTRVTHTIYTIVKPTMLQSLFSRGSVNKNVSGALQKLKENVEAGRAQRWI